MSDKISIRFFEDREVRAIWDDEHAKWWFSVLDIVGVLNRQDDYTKNRNYWKYLKTKLKREQNELVSVTNQLRLLAPDGKKRLTDVLDSEGVIRLAKEFPNTRAGKFLDWFTYSDTSIDGQSKKKAYDLFESGLLNTLEPSSIKCLQQIHAYIFGGLYDFAGKMHRFPLEAKAPTPPTPSPSTTSNTWSVYNSKCKPAVYCPMRRRDC